MSPMLISKTRTEGKVLSSGTSSLHAINTGAFPGMNYLQSTEQRGHNSGRQGSSVFYPNSWSSLYYSSQRLGEHPLCACSRRSRSRCSRRSPPLEETPCGTVPSRLSREAFSSVLQHFRTASCNHGSGDVPVRRLHWIDLGTGL